MLQYIQSIISFLTSPEAMALLGSVVAIATAAQAFFMLLAKVSGWQWAHAAGDWLGIIAADIGKLFGKFSKKEQPEEKE